ncbi:glutamine synthetase III [Chitinivibrio alkaliphilus]|uniref:Glutamine synthetase n=1 Tax=Chitinivibrio alkaliphilus ACht1 TaxID=1313304 RepID=U7D591_9BACT|nr:glutamine synthetase III [Chitinivibrio alkaliphilus]ERP31113.1 glutamine synthetase [Chitinivibrio alkaliphilus ACht1]
MTTRSEAVRAISAEKPGDTCVSSGGFSLTDEYGTDVFNLRTMKKVLSKEVVRSLTRTIREGAPLDPAITDEVATAMKNWAVGRGATHFTHWFQPLTGATAEKHDSFIEPDDTGGVLMNFSGKNLVQGEPDASSFPSGGIRETFEARGYTAWDPSSPAFIRRDTHGATLCIPTAFCSYTGEALDKKTPLLRSMEAVSEKAKRVLSFFREVSADDVVRTTLGAEQEYFLVDKRFYYAREDLVQTGRTLFGKLSAKNQQMDDHYFGSIKSRVIDFMSELDRELWRLGIPAKTRHNEVAPAQFELAAQFEETNIAVDHNMLVMETLRSVSDRHGFVCLLNEKPFAGVNGSGKHNNWSLSYKGENLLEPGEDAHKNVQFLTFLCAIIAAVDKHADLLRIAVGSAGNDHRLGANEAPPAIISMFLGSQLTDVIEQLEREDLSSTKQGGVMNIGAEILPRLPMDATDRNRTSPFAFTGNKFEFRAVGSSHSCAGANIVLNTIVAESLDELATRMESIDRDNFEAGLQKVLADTIKYHKRIIFNGDNYSDAWVKEAEKRGLLNLKTTPEALPHLLSEKNRALFSMYNVMNERELESRHEVFTEEYTHTIDIEGKVALDISRTKILPAAIEQMGVYASTLKAVAALSRVGSKAIQKELDELGTCVDELSTANEALEAAVEKGGAKEIIAAMEAVRTSVDTLEECVDDRIWPLPKYREMLFIM